MNQFNFMFPEILTQHDLIMKPLNSSHELLLTELASDKRIWEYAPHPYFIESVFKEEWFEKALAQIELSERKAFVIFSENKIIGSTSYYDINPKYKKLNIGYTWFHPTYWGTYVNALSKYMLLEYAFEQLKFNRVEFSVDSRNKRSCQALTKLGIQQEGILRNDMILPDNTRRHSVIFSIILEEWPAFKLRFHYV